MNYDLRGFCIMIKEQLLQRTRLYALRIIRVVQALPRNDVSRILGQQLLRAGTSVGANYRAACRAKSGPDFINKLKIVEEEGDESLYWMDLLIQSGSMPQRRLAALVREGDEIVAVVVSALKTLHGRRST
jgi:four helix bundle protein